MFHLTREVRFAINSTPDDQLSSRPTNSYAGYPSTTGLAYYFTLQATLTGPVDPTSSYLLNIKDIDQRVREIAIPHVANAIAQNKFRGGGNIAIELFDKLRDAWPRFSLLKIRLGLTPFLAFCVHSTEHPMVRLSQRFEFSASHRLHSPKLSDEENRRTFGKCNNPNGHGHNYEVQVTLRGEPDTNGVIMLVPHMERVVADTVIERFDHKNLNCEVPEFQNVMPSVENIAKVIYQMLKPKFTDRAALASVTVWETPKTSCEYSE